MYNIVSYDAADIYDDEMDVNCIVYICMSTCIVLYCIGLYHIVYTVFNVYIVLYSIVPNQLISYCIILHCILSCCIVLYRIATVVRFMVLVCFIDSDMHVFGCVVVAAASIFSAIRVLV